MRPSGYLLALVGVALALQSHTPPAGAAEIPVRVLPVDLKGKLLDFTANHGRDCRRWSAILGEKRDLYVYVPPGYTAQKRYPVLIWLHAMDQDERGLLDAIIFQIDRGIHEGWLPPMIVAAPDGTLSGAPAFVGNGSFFLNTPRGGQFEDHLLQEVWPFLLKHFSIREEPQARVMAGISMGGFAAFNKVLKDPCTFGVAMGIFPPLHLRYADTRGNILTDYRKENLALREDFDRPDRIVGRFFLFFQIRQRHVLDPLYDPQNPVTLPLIASENPYELLDRNRHLGKVALYVGYGGKDEFNADAHAEAFTQKAADLGIGVATERLPNGGHLRCTALRLLPGGLRWIGQQLRHHGPIDCAR